jgi:hypothetical protein
MDLDIDRWRGLRLAATHNDQRTPEDEAMVRQLCVAAGALAHALMGVPRQQPPMPTPLNLGSPS